MGSLVLFKGWIPFFCYLCRSAETVMSMFHSHTVAAQQHQVTLTKHYDPLLACEPSALSEGLVRELILCLDHLRQLLQVARTSLLARSLRPQKPNSNPPPTSDPLTFSTATHWTHRRIYILLREDV
ncbi:hypothetical protein DFH94DRAFT_718790 [Russula ochroleuca]|uniref:Uncharacterized protein n=1 Tax=Russula ochroleuca TaxID=152965 RepID=A0A9P5TD52_9AGAM|nr:hypothetical protein DFH94DRAFT_718790 [Russula ochroleuca]